MSVAISFDDAVAGVLEYSENADAYDTVERLERLILTHTPVTPSEAAGMLKVAVENLLIGGRSDGLDVGAVVIVRDFLLRTI